MEDSDKKVLVLTDRGIYNMDQLMAIVMVDDEVQLLDDDEYVLVRQPITNPDQEAVQRAFRGMQYRLYHFIEDESQGEFSVDLVHICGGRK